VTQRSRDDSWNFARDLVRLASEFLKARACASKLAVRTRVSPRKPKVAAGSKAKGSARARLIAPPANLLLPLSISRSSPDKAFPPFEKTTPARAVSGILQASAH